MQIWAWLGRELSKRPFSWAIKLFFSALDIIFQIKIVCLHIYINSFKFRKFNQGAYASVQRTPRRGNEHIAQGIALGMMKRWCAPWRGKSVRIHSFWTNAFALAGRNSGGESTQGVALGYTLAGPSARSINACQLQVNTCETWINSFSCKMENKDLNRLKVVLAEKKKTNKWLAEQLGKDPATISKWCTNSAQPNLENLVEIAKCLEVTVNDLIR